ncbi:hypothetical protein [Natronospira bacteriovora]|uniref:Lipoprotein n=1 Tax=Natronospira bacteriovora TaxID=3069753 RepID=A0ABU0W576_9GAMM|nr:hypothetical protein [Natronospira sp. AB-CW4]MDQ2069169.1 hypothetical protein [Natronospira sp. AB-CW4]
MNTIRNRRFVIGLSALLSTAFLLSGCFNSSSNDADDDFSEFFPATMDCESVAEEPENLFDLDNSETPRIDRVAETLSLEASGEVMAPTSVYNRVVAEMVGITSRYPDSAHGRIRSCRPPNRIEAFFSEEAYDRLLAGEYQDWDELNEFLRTTFTLNDDERRASLRFDGRYNTNRLAEEYLALDGIIETTHREPPADGDDICLAVRGDFHFYIFRHGLNCDGENDCPDERFFAVQADSSGNFEQVGHWSGNDEAPMWFDNAEDCRVFLSGQGSF